MRAEPEPEIAFGQIESYRLATRDGEQIGAWFIPGQPDEPVVLLLHGNGADRRSCLPQAEFLVRAGYSALLITHRAHGDSTGDRNDFGYSARFDVLAAVDWLEGHCPGREIFVFGQSLGASASMFAARELGGRVKGYIWECPYDDIRTAVRNRTRAYLPPVLDQIAYAGLRCVSPLVLPQPDVLSPAKAVAAWNADTPVLILAGGRDDRATMDQARHIQREAGSASVRLEVFDQAAHLQLMQADPERYGAITLRFICGF